MQCTYLFIVKNNFKKDVLLSGVVTAARNLIGRDFYDGEIAEKLLRCTGSADDRLVANAIETLGWLENLDGSLLNLEHLNDHSNNRVVANLLIRNGAKQFAKAEAQQAKAMLESGVPSLVSSCAYALTEIATKHLRNDAVQFHANSFLRREIERALSFSGHKHEMVLRQTLRLAELVATVPHYLSAA